MEYIVITDTRGETGGGCVVDVESTEKANDGGFVYMGVYHGTNDMIRHKQYEPAKVYNSIGPAIKAAKTWEGN